MAGPTPRSTASAPAPQHADKVGAIVGEFLAEKEQQIREIEAIEARRAKGRRPILAISLAILCAALWIAPSLLGEATAAPSPERLEAGTRMTLFLASERIRAYHREHGKLPASLADAGVDSTGMSYRPGPSDSFELAMTANGTRLAYHSTMNNAAFLGSTFQILTRP